MKNIVVIISLAVVVAAGYFFINKPTDEAEVVTVPANGDAAVVAGDAEENLITPLDMPEQAQEQMYAAITDYNKCMMQNRLEYHQQGVQVADMADKTLLACEPNLDVLAEIFTANNVNEGLNKKMVSTMRSRAARKLMAAVMQSMAGQTAAMDNAANVEAQ